MSVSIFIFKLSQYNEQSFPWEIFERFNFYKGKRKKNNIWRDGIYLELGSFKSVSRINWAINLNLVKQ